MNNFYKVLVFSLFIFFILSLILFLSSKKKINSKILSERSYWKGKINNLGVEKAYQVLKKENLKNDIQQQHTTTHLFGELLFEKEDLKAITVCDDSFGFGCYHSVFGSALVKYGPNIISKINEYCIVKYGKFGTGCQHGIGHGILEYFGHDKLAKALEECSKIQFSIFLGCTSGVFMEYNFPNLIKNNADFSKRRTFDPDNPFAPCPSLESRFRQSCYFDQTQFWITVYEKDYSKLSNLCKSLNDRSEKEACFMGIGNTASTFQRNLNFSKNTCDKMPNPEAKLFCSIGASWGFFTDPKTKSLALTMCNQFENDKKNICINKSDFTRFIRN